MIRRVRFASYCWPDSEGSLTRRARSYFRSSITTDFGGSVAFKAPDSIAAPVKAAGFTTAGWSNVLWALIAAAVSTRPVTPVAGRVLTAADRKSTRLNYSH